jgi:acetolactate synthase regulatory subunit
VKHTLSVVVEDRPGALTRITTMFARRAFNIESLAVGPTERPGVSCITLRVDCTQHSLEQIEKQIHKLVNVLRVTELVAGEAGRAGAARHPGLGRAREARRARHDGRGARRPPARRRLRRGRARAHRHSPRSSTPSTSCASRTGSSTSSARAGSAFPARPPQAPGPTLAAIN